MRPITSSQLVSGITTAALIFALFCHAQAAEANSQPASPAEGAVFNAVIPLINGGQAEKAKEKLEALIKQDPQWSAPESALGLVLMKMAKEEEAATHLKRAVSLNPADSVALGNLGVALMDLGDKAGAKVALEQQAKLEPGNAECLANLGALYSSTGDLESALKCFQEFVRRFPSNEHTPMINSTKEKIEGLLADRKKHGYSPDSKDYVAESSKDGTRWSQQRMPLRVCIHSGKELAGFQPDYDDVLKQAFADWQNASNQAITFQYVSSPDKADINCYWTSDSKQLQNPFEEGTAKPYIKGHEIVSSEIYILTKTLFQQGYGSSTWTTSALKHTCLHEIGHTLGLFNHSTNANDIMYFAVGAKSKNDTLSERDVNTILRLYTAETASKPN